jgi:thymidylate synthase (FAD)
MTQIKATYVDHMGTDLTVVNAARVSFANHSKWEGGSHPDFDPIRTLYPRDEKLIKYLAKHRHTSPFGHAFASFNCKAPLFVHAQLVKHKFLRTNTISRRYSTENIEFYVPEAWRGRSADKKQGSEGIVDVGDWGDTNWACLIAYNDLLGQGVAPEQARMVLPQSTMTEWYWSGSLDAFADMCNLRCAPDTQYETRQVADQISVEMGDMFPVSWAALMSNP